MHMCCKHHLCVHAQPAKMDRHQGAFWREADLLSKLNHPNVLRMYGVVCQSSQDPTIVGIICEFVKGGSLTASLRRACPAIWFPRGVCFRCRG